MNRPEGGMTLLELMIVVAVVAILASIAVPSYQRYVMRAQRTDATAALLRIASAQEKYYLQNNTYASLSTLGISATEHGWYTLTLPNPPPDATQFTAQADAPSGSRQYKDTDCRTFTITSTGQRGAKKADAADNTETCWR